MTRPALEISFGRPFLNRWARSRQESWGCHRSGSMACSPLPSPPGTGKDPAEGSSFPTVPFPAGMCSKEAGMLLLNEVSVTGGDQGKTRQKQQEMTLQIRVGGKAESLPPPQP